MTQLAVQQERANSISTLIGIGSRFDRLIFWCSEQDKKNHIGWVGFSITVMTVIFFPLTMMSILLHGANFGLIIPAMVSLNLVVITNLAALSTKYTIPFLIVGMLTDVVVVIVSFIG